MTRSCVRIYESVCSPQGACMLCGRVPAWCYLCELFIISSRVMWSIYLYIYVYIRVCVFVFGLHDSQQELVSYVLFHCLRQIVLCTACVRHSDGVTVTRCNAHAYRTDLHSLHGCAHTIRHQETNWLILIHLVHMNYLCISLSMNKTTNLPFYTSLHMVVLND